MQFIDEAVIHLHAGDGGNGVAAFRREDGVPRGGPSGGDGGNGGSIIVIADPQLSSLLDFKYKRHYKGERGEDGRSKDQYGAKGEDLVVRVPVGTIIYRVTDREPPAADAAALEEAPEPEAADAADDDDTLMDDAADPDTVADDEPAASAPLGAVLADLTTAGARFVIAKGGKGGKGNIHFKTPWNQAPTTCEPGTPGDLLTVRLELKLLADVGLLGYPNVGKSTFIAHVSRARPKIADYPFTTLVPNLGVVQLSDDRHFVIADIPGLIEGASEGAGLGHQFLRHVERCHVLLHIVECTYTTGPDRDPLADYRVINRELAQYAPDLAKKRQIVALNKSDAVTPETIAAHKATFLEEEGVELLVMSAATGEGLAPVLEKLWACIRSPA